MAKRWIEIDDDLLARAGQQLGVTAEQEIVRLALEHVAAIGSRLREVESLRSGAVSALVDKDVRRAVWR